MIISKNVVIIHHSHLNIQAQLSTLSFFVCCFVYLYTRKLKSIYQTIAFWDFNCRIVIKRNK